jgi:hypothetical protein
MPNALAGLAEDIRKAKLYRLAASQQMLAIRAG